MTKRLPVVSQAERWIHCPASFKAQIAYPRLDNTPSQAALEGRSCHTMLEELRAGGTLVSGAGSLDEEHGVIRTQDMIGAVYECFNVTPDHAVLESRIDLSIIYPGWYGFCDAYFFEDGVLRVYDYKFGHTYVQVEENVQLIAYALGIIAIEGLSDDHEVILHILQPRDYRSGEPRHRKWSTSVGELRNYTKVLHDAITEALKPVPPASTGKQCKYCSARANCKAFKEVQYDCIDYAGSLSLTNITNEQIGVDLVSITSAIEHLKNAQNALEEQALHKLKNGEQVRGWSLDTVRGRTK